MSTIFYNNINGLLKSNIELEYTPEQLNEIIRCRYDIEYFLEKYVKIINLDKGKVPFILYDYQKELINLFQTENRVISLQARQSGKTILTSGYILHYILFNQYKNVAILANKGGTARKILAKIKTMYKNLPIWMQVGVEEWNKGFVEFGNKNIIEASATTADGIRGDSVNLLYLDELAFVQKNLWEDFWESTYPTISSSKTAKIIISSTPNGMNHFYKFWTEALKNKNGYKYLKVLWQQVPGRDEQWKIDTIKGLNGGLEKFNQEFSCEFLGSAGTLINSYTLKNQLIYSDPISSTYENKLKIYKNPEEKRQYILMLDPAEGLGQDYSTIQVLDITDEITEQVAVYKDNTISTREFPYVVQKISEIYNDGLIIGENNLFGEILNDLNYELECEVFFDDKFGIRMTTGSKSTGNSFLKRDIEDGNIIINDFDTISEFSTYIKIKNSYGADEGYHDDLITPLVLFSYFMKNKVWVENWIEGDDKYNPGNTKKINEDLLPAGFVDDGNEIENFEGNDEYMSISK